jgi:hypothetical protein
MIEVIKGTAKQNFPIDKIAAVALQLAGGGYTVAQTAKAMEIQADLKAGKTVKAKGFTVKIID